jgi:hypothetical protein
VKAPITPQHRAVWCGVDLFAHFFQPFCMNPSTNAPSSMKNSTEIKRLKTDATAGISAAARTVR